MSSPLSSTAIEFGLINTLRTGHVLVDALLCMLVPVVIQRVVTALTGSQTSLWQMLKSYFFPVTDVKYVTRLIEFTERFNRYGSIWDEDQQVKLLQKAISIRLSDVVNLRNKNARCELIEKTKKRKKSKSLEDSSSEADDAASDASTAGSDASENVTEADSLCIEALPPLGQWVTIESGVEFMHEVETPENGDDKGVKENKVKFHFRSSLPDGSRRIDEFVHDAFEQYRLQERAKYTSDKSRYFYIQCGTKPSQSDSSTQVVAYKRYALGEEKTFENLFFDEKAPVISLLDNFMNKTGKFAIRGFPYKLGFLLHGPPGTGKTSLIKAIAQHTKRHIVTINLSKIRTNQELLDAVFDLKFSVEDMDYPISLSFKDVVFVMEDIDCASRIVEKRDNSDSKYEQKRESRVERMVESQKKAEMDDDDMPGLIGPMPKPKDTSNDKLNLSGLLNVLDGVIDCPGRIVVMTTNHPEKLDPALIRPGRVNKMLLLTHMNSTQARHMIEYYCQAKLSEQQSERLDSILVNATKQLTPAEVEEFCAEFDDPEQILREMERHSDASMVMF
ncbi:hypothetical protein P43SY_007237 [Pythium insidiosum]|uniref:AAA+ ATPase domain-containing protein n=1 Tax=Pythium insidiosum TaxID=114742 RepID=A0AAD5LG88_PYTIN|nr:hypothetical protein P43SY_007237 [Pythium insidiosum]